MKVVIFCGGFGMRIREHSENIPKPMVTIGYRPILWHLMRYYAHYGHKDFILCLGYRADAIKNYFLNYEEAISNDFVLTNSGKNIELLNADIQDWRMTFVDTGLYSNIGQRLVAVQKYLDDEDVFLANYADGLADLPLPKLIEHFYKHNKTACFVCVKPSQSSHVVWTDGNSTVKRISHITDGGFLMNGGFFVFKKEIFDYIREGDELVQEPFQRLIENKELVAYKHDGFWGCMDTFKEKEELERIYALGNAPWEVWNSSLESEKYSSKEVKVMSI